MDQASKLCLCLNGQQSPTWEQSWEPRHQYFRQTMSRETTSSNKREFKIGNLYRRMLTRCMTRTWKSTSANSNPSWQHQALQTTSKRCAKLKARKSNSVALALASTQTAETCSLLPMFLKAKKCIP